MKIKKLSRFTVAARQENGGWWDVEVIAASLREARRIGVEVMSNDGVISKFCIKETTVHNHNDDMWAGA